MLLRCDILNDPEYNFPDIKLSTISSLLILLIAILRAIINYLDMILKDWSLTDITGLLKVIPQLELKSFEQT